MVGQPAFLRPLRDGTGVGGVGGSADGFFPLRPAGFASNPFRVLTEEELAEVAVLPAELLAALGEPGGPHVQLLGDAGRGKSTTLLGAAARLRREGARVAVEYLPVGVSRFSTPTRGLDAYVLDEAQRLSPRERRRLFGGARAGTRLLLGSHEDMTTAFDRAGLPLRSVLIESLGGGHFRAALLARIEHAAVSSGEHATLAPDALDWLRERFGTDLRSAERFLYGVYQSSIRSPEPVTAARLMAAPVF